MNDKQRKAHNKIQVLNFLSLVEHLHQSPSKASLKSAFNPLMNDFLNDPDKEILENILLNKNESSFKNVGLVIVKYYEELALKKRRLKQVQ